MARLVQGLGKPKGMLMQATMRLFIPLTLTVMTGQLVINVRHFLCDMGSLNVLAHGCTFCSGRPWRMVLVVYGFPTKVPSLKSNPSQLIWY